MKWDFKIVVLLVEWSSFRGGLKAGFYCITLLNITVLFWTSVYIVWVKHII